jgi:hypothetical protein
VSFKLSSSIITISEVSGPSDVANKFYLLNIFDTDSKGSSTVAWLLITIGLNGLKAEFGVYTRSYLRFSLVGGPTYFGGVSKKSSNLSFNFSPLKREGAAWD